jgi:hypothetical protein
MQVGAPTIFHVFPDGKNWLLIRLGSRTGQSFHNFRQAKDYAVAVARDHRPSRLVVQDSRSVFEYVEYDEDGKEFRSPG